MKTIATLINYSCKSFSHFSDVFFLKFATSCVASWHFIWIFVNQNGWFFARFAIMIFAITCISNLIATKFDDKDAYLLILELAVKLVWSIGSCDHMNSSSPIIVHFPSIVFLISSIFKSRVSSSKAWITVVFGHPLCSGHKTSFFCPLCLTQSSSPLFTKQAWFLAYLSVCYPASAFRVFMSLIK